MEFKPECRHCKTAMKPGFLVNSDHASATGFFLTPPITVTGCWKCPACGHSFVPRVHTTT